MNTASISKDRTAIWYNSLTLLISVVLFDLLFWDLALGLNLLLFVLLMVALLIHRYSWSSLSTIAKLSLVGALWTGSMVVMHNTAIAVLATLVTLAIGAALVQEGRLRSLFYASIQTASNFVMVPIGGLRKVEALVPEQGASRRAFRWFKLGVLPLLFVVLFTQLYRAGNPRFDALTAGFMEGVWDLLYDLFNGFFTAHTFFLLFGLAVCAGLLFRFAPNLAAQLEEGMTDRLVRIRQRRPQWSVPLAMDPLERERRMGVILLMLANVLLAVVNVIDINWVWFGFEVPVGFSLKQFVHEGTWMLIISILLSMMILLHLFRKNQNFYSRSAGLRKLALLWVAQNFILGVSVFLRNYHYISFHGLAYKRIGVIVFLGLVLVGLITLYIKLVRTRSFFYLARVNGWAAIIVLIGLASVDWDSTIVRYNLAHWNQGEIDVDNYLQMSDKVLPLLYADLDKVEAQMAQHRSNTVRWVEHLDPGEFRNALDAKRDRFMTRYQGQRWQEMNLADGGTALALQTLPLR